MQIKKITFILCAIFSCFNMATAQVKISCADLASTKWKALSSYNAEWGIDYQESAENEYYEFNRAEMVWHQPNGRKFTYKYYLSDTVPTEFQSSKVGSMTKGRYCVIYNPVLKTFDCRLILHFDKNAKKMRFTFVNPQKPDTYGGLTEYELIPEQATPRTSKPTYDTPLEQIHTKEYDVLQRETSTGGNTTTSGKTSTSGNSSTGKSTSTSGGSTTKAQTNKYIDPKDQLTPLKEWK